jgi:hypothetical protein
MSPAAKEDRARFIGRCVRIVQVAAGDRQTRRAAFAGQNQNLLRERLQWGQHNVLPGHVNVVHQLEERPVVGRNFGISVEYNR